MDNVVRRGVVSLEETCQVVQYFLYSPQKKPPASPSIDEEEPEDEPLLPIDIRLKILRDLLQQLSTPNTVFDKSSPSKALPPRIASSQFRNFILDKLEKLDSIQHLLQLYAISLVSNQTCIDELICYFADSLRQHLQELSAGTWNSQARIALFLRQTLVNFQKMSFKAVANLCSQIQEVVEAEKAAGKSIAGGAIRFSSATEANRSLSQLPALLPREKYSEFLEKALTTSVAALRVAYPRASRWHYVRCLYGVQRGDVQLATESLHRYFDTIDPQPQPIHVGYAPYVLGCIWMQLGYPDESICSLHEAVRLAQERNDQSLIAAALTAIFHVLLSSPSKEFSSSSGLLLQILQKARNISPQISETQRSVISALSSLTWANFILFAQTTASSSSPHESHQIFSAVFDSLSDAAAKSFLASPANPLLERSAADLADMNACRILLKATQWQLYGHKSLSCLFTQMQMLLDQYAPDAPADFWPSSVQHVLLTYVKLAFLDLEEGRAAKCARILSEAFSKFPAHFKYAACSILSTGSFLTILQHSIARMDSESASIASAQLSAILSGASPLLLPRALSYAIEQQRAALLKIRGNFSESSLLIESLVSDAKSCWQHRGDVHVQMLMELLELGDLHLQCGSAFTSLRFVLNCLAACEDAQMLETIRVRAIVLLTRIRSQIGLSGRRSIALLESVYPHLVQHASLKTRADSLMAHAIAEIHANSSSSSLQKAKERVLEALTYFESLEDLAGQQEAQYTLARLFHTLEDFTSRDRCASRFKQITESLSLLSSSQRSLSALRNGCVTNANALSSAVNRVLETSAAAKMM